MGTVATLAVNVIARTGDFNKGLDKAGTKAKGFGKSVGSASGGATGGLMKFVPALALATTAAAVATVAYRELGAAFARIDEMAKKASRLGITSQSLKALSYSAELAGASADVMNDVIKTLQKNMGDAAMGTGEAAASLKVLGLDVDKLAGMDADEQFKTISEAISKIENPALQAALAAKIFGEGSQQVMDVIRGGNDALEENEQRLKHLQGTIDKTDETAVADMHDAWTDVQKAIEGLWEQLSVLLAPALEMIGNILAEVIAWVTRSVEWFRRLGDEWNGLILLGSPLLGIIKMLGGANDKQTEAVKKLTAAEKLQAVEALKTAEAEQKAIEETAKAREALEKKGAKLTESLRSPLEKYNDTVGELNTMLDAGVISWDTYGRAVAKAQDDIKKSDEFKAKEIKVAERQAVGVSLRGRGAFSIQQKQQRTLEKLREEERQQLKQLKQQTTLLQQLNNNVQTGTVVTI
jgi:hypothetical protein